jgi:DHA1 family bicyclomycin/chloramphenicol resistance-like MFS transporter
MSQALAGSADRSTPEPSFREFVFLIALVMALVSLSIDNLLPAFEPIRTAFGVADANEM